MRKSLDVEMQIARARLAGLVRMVAAAENRALKLEVEKGEEAAAPARAAVERYRAELARLEACAGHRDVKPENVPLEDGGAAAEVALQELRQVRELEQARAELAQVREERDQALTVVELQRARAALVADADPDPVAKAAAVLRGLTPQEMGDAMLKACGEVEAPIVAPPPRLRGAHRAPRHPTLEQLDRRPQRAEVEVTYVA